MAAPTDAGGPVPISTDSVGQRTIAVSYDLTARRIMAFAAGVNDANPVYFDDTRDGGLIGHPGMAFSFQWNSRHTPDRTIDPRTARYNVHAWTDLRFERPFREGDVITCQGEIIAVQQVKPGVLSVARYTMTDSRGATVAVMDTGGITRTAVADGPDHGRLDAPPLPQRSDANDAPLWLAQVPIAPEAAQVYTECAEIYNPIHTERRVALAAGLPDIILHGSATQTIALRELIDRALHGDPTRVARLTGQYRAMVLLDHPITVRCLEDRPRPDGGREIFYDVLTHDGQAAVANGVLISHPA